MDQQVEMQVLVYTTKEQRRKKAAFWEYNGDGQVVRNIERQNQVQFTLQRFCVFFRMDGLIALEEEEDPELSSFRQAKPLLIRASEAVWVKAGGQSDSIRSVPLSFKMAKLLQIIVWHKRLEWGRGAGLQCAILLSPLLTEAQCCCNLDLELHFSNAVNHIVQPHLGV